nr:SLA class II histocompatibility antigen, DQ haplotype D alpha chain-like [Pogona vitticeps]
MLTLLLFSSFPARLLPLSSTSLSPPPTPPVHKEAELDFFQESLPSGPESGEFLQSFDEEEIFHVDWAQKENVWRLPYFAQHMSFEVQGALGNLAVMKNNLEIMRKRSNQTRAQNGRGWGWRSGGAPLPDFSWKPQRCLFRGRESAVFSLSPPLVSLPPIAFNHGGT